MVIKNATSQDLKTLQSFSTIYSSNTFNDGGIKVEAWKDNQKHIFYIEKKHLPLKLSNKVMSFPSLV